MKTHPSPIFVLGTDTGVGKSVLSLLLMQFFYAQGCTPFYLKPLQTGCRNPYDADSDARFIYNHVDALKGKDPADSVIYCFNNPKAPWFAARDEGQTVDLKVIRDIALQKQAAFAPLIIEGAGGLFVPVDAHHMTTDLLELTGARPLIAARAGLGTINHTLLTLEVIKAKGFDPLGVVLLNGGESPSTPEITGENIEAIEHFSGVRVAGVIERIDDFSRPDKACSQVVRKLLNQSIL